MTDWGGKYDHLGTNYDYLGNLTMTTWEKHHKILHLVVNQINAPIIENNLFGNLFISA